MEVYQIHDNALGMLINDHSRYWPVAVQAGWNVDAFGETDRIKIARAVERLSTEQQPVNESTVFDALQGECTGLLLQMISNAPIGQNFDWFISQVIVWYHLKRFVFDFGHIAEEIMRSPVSSSTDAVIVRIQTLAEKIQNVAVLRRATFEMPDILNSALNRIESRMTDADQGKRRGIGTGIKKIDDATLGLVKGRFYIIAARTSVGKTTFASFLCLEAMKQGAYPLFFSNEMDKEDLIEKFIAAEGRVHAYKMQNGLLTDVDDVTRFRQGFERTSKYRICIEEKAGWNLDQLLSMVYLRHRDKKCDVVFVDYLQQVRVTGSDTKYEQVSVVSDAMKKLSRDLDIPVVGLAQINRESERSGKPTLPNLSHLKDSGSLEQDADVVMILHKDDLALPEVTVAIAKNRYGATGTIQMRHIQPYHVYEQV